MTPQSLQSIQYMIDQNPNPKLFKKIVISLRTILTKTLFLLIDKQSLEYIGLMTPEKMMEIWNMIHSIAERTVTLGLKHNNESIRLHSIRLLEMLIISHSSAPAHRLYFVTPLKQVRWCSKVEDYFRLELIPNGHPVLKPEEMSKKGAVYLGLILDELMRRDTAHSMVTVILQSLLSITKQRMEYWDRIFGFLSSFPESMPESLSSSQMQSVLYLLKAMFLFLLRMPQTRIHRVIFEEALEQLQCRKDIVQQTIKLAELFKDIDPSGVDAPQRSSRKRAAGEQLEQITKVRKIQEGGLREQQPQQKLPLEGKSGADLRPHAGPDSSM